jgi:hypothetical protein
MNRCNVASANTLGHYFCTREQGHEGPCAAVPSVTEPSPRQQGGDGREAIALEWARDVIAELQGYGVAIDPARRELIADCDAQLLKCQFLDAATLVPEAPEPAKASGWVPEPGERVAYGPNTQEHGKVARVLTIAYVDWDEGHLGSHETCVLQPLPAPPDSEASK